MLYLQIISSSVIVNGHLFGKSYSLGIPCVLYVICLYVISVINFLILVLNAELWFQFIRSWLLSGYGNTAIFMPYLSLYTSQGATKLIEKETKPL